uniref:Uncharacterized protein n=1 Tax=Oryza sativa subsp. japonica TaxID=39947 RepID=Q69KR2_ORYSJ|nr:hypothetical protein [Oryza sativa Japonica Group]
MSYYVDPYTGVPQYSLYPVYGYPPSTPSIEQALREEEIEEDVDQAAAEALADLFSFDIKDYLDEQTEEDTPSKANHSTF